MSEGTWSEPVTWKCSTNPYRDEGDGSVLKAFSLQHFICIKKLTFLLPPPHSLHKASYGWPEPVCTSTLSPALTRTLWPFSSPWAVFPFRLSPHTWWRQSWLPHLQVWSSNTSTSCFHPLQSPLGPEEAPACNYPLRKLNRTANTRFSSSAVSGDLGLRGAGPKSAFPWTQPVDNSLTFTFLLVHPGHPNPELVDKQVFIPLPKMILPINNKVGPSWMENYTGCSGRPLDRLHFSGIKKNIEKGVGRAKCRGTCAFLFEDHVFYKFC